MLSATETDGRNAALEEACALLKACDTSAVRAAKMVLRQAETSGVFSNGSEAGTCWSFERERAQLHELYRRLAPLETLYSQFITDAGEAIGSARSAIVAHG